MDTVDKDIAEAWERNALRHGHEQGYSEGFRAGVKASLEAITKTEHAEFRPDTIYIDLAEAAKKISKLLAEQEKK